MGSNCCKTIDVKQVDVSKVAPFDNPSGLVNMRDLTFDKFDSQSPYSHILWKRGELIGKGVFGKVYQAMDLDTGEIYAVKSVQLSHVFQEFQNQFSSLSKEIDLLRTLKHKNIVQYFQTDIDLEKNTVNIVLEFVTGGSLRDLLNKYGGFSEKITKNYTLQILKALAYMHSKNIVHRDLKSANILVSKEAVLKLTDFGCSKVVLESDDISRSIKGSPYWMAPEIVLRQGHGKPSDIWSLGCLIIEMFSGMPPWSDVTNKADEVIRLISIKNNIPKIPDLPPDLSDIVRSCLIREPDSRPTAQSLLSLFTSASYSSNSITSVFTKSTNSLLGNR